MTLGIVNTVGSSISRETDAGIYNHAGPEISVASTKAFVSQMVTLILFTVHMGRLNHMSFQTAQEILKRTKKSSWKNRKNFKSKLKTLKKLQKSLRKLLIFYLLGESIISL